MRASRAIHGLCILAVPPLAALHLVIAVQGSSLQAAPFFIAAALVGVLAADLLTGGIHWACDTWGSAETRYVGPSLIGAFRAHHHDPAAMAEHSWVNVNRQSALPACLALGLLLWPAQTNVGDLLETQRGILFRVFATCFIAAAALTNQFHQWAHQPTPPRIARWLQTAGVILSPERHALHHSRGHDQAYCVSNGWMNPLLDRVGWWRGLERLIERATGTSPQRGNGTAIDLGFGNDFKGDRSQNAVGGLVGGESHGRSPRARVVRRRRR